jgi:hypothetical protein
MLQAMTGRDELQIPGLGDGTILTNLSECGTDMTRWKTSEHFTTQLGLAPQDKITGGRLKSSRTRGGAGRAVGASPPPLSMRSLQKTSKGRCLPSQSSCLANFDDKLAFWRFDAIHFSLLEGQRHCC